MKVRRKDFVTISEVEMTAETPGVTSQQRSEGRQRLLQCHAAYAKLKRFTAEIRVDTQTDFSIMTTLRNTIDGKLSYKAPNELEWTAVSPSDRITHLIQISKEGVFVSDSSGGSRRERREDVASALCEFAGVSCHLSTYLPAIVLGTEYSAESMFMPHGQLLPAFASGAYLDGEEEFNDHRCDRVICPRKIGTWTFWIDQESTLLRGIREETSPAQTATQRDFGGGGISGTIAQSNHLQTFRIVDAE